METRTVTNADLTPEERLRQRLYVESRQDGGNPSEFLEMLASVVEQRVWEKLGISFVDLIEKGYPTGIGSSRAEIETMIRLHHKHEAGSPKLRKRMDAMRETVGRLLREEVPELAEHRRPTKEEQARKRDNTNLKGRGTSAAYILARLKRDRPDLAEKVVSGEMSANAAAIEAGFRKKTFTVPEDIPGLAQALVNKGIDRDELHKAMGEILGEPQAESTPEPTSPGDRSPKTPAPAPKKPRYKRYKDGSVAREIPEIRLSDEEIWEQHLDLIDQVHNLWHKLFNLGRAAGNKALQKYGVGAEEYLEVSREYMEISELVESAFTTEIHGITGELKVDRELQMVQRGNAISTELGERIIGLRAPNNSILARLRPKRH